MEVVDSAAPSDCSQMEMTGSSSAAATDVIYLLLLLILMNVHPWRQIVSNSAHSYAMVSIQNIELSVYRHRSNTNPDRRKPVARYTLYILHYIHTPVQSESSRSQSVSEAVNRE